MIEHLGRVEERLVDALYDVAFVKEGLVDAARVENGPPVGQGVYAARFFSFFGKLNLDIILLMWVGIMIYLTWWWIELGSRKS